MGMKPAAASFVALGPEQHRADNERSVRSSAPIGWSLPPPETPDVMGLECREGGRKERIWGGGRLSSLSQAESPKDKPSAFLTFDGKAERHQTPITPNCHPTYKPSTKAAHGYAETRVGCELAWHAALFRLGYPRR